ncbi:MAG: radical SAM protein [Rhodospirillales bacterium]|nr:radical SAM protein [Rhodospirillales bacterium]
MMHLKPVWVGISPSEIKGIEHLFSGLITIIGSSQGETPGSFSLESEFKTRINYNDPDNYQLCDDFLSTKVREIREREPLSTFFWQDQQSFSITDKLELGTIANNRLPLIQFLANKIMLRALVARFMGTLPGLTVFKSECHFANLRELMPDNLSFVVQEPYGSGGHNTLLVASPSDDERIAGLSADILIVTGYLEKSIPLNQHIVIFDNECVILPPSVQIVSLSQGGSLLYNGGDFSAVQIVDDSVLSHMRRASEQIGALLRDNGYRGVAGIDYLVRGHELFFIEINPRFQSSTTVLNQSLLMQGCPSVQELHLMAFAGKPPQVPASIKAQGAFLIGLNDGTCLPQYQDLDLRLSSPDKRQTMFSQDDISIRLFVDGLDPQVKIEPFTKLWRLETNRQIVCYDPLNGITVDHAISSYLTSSAFRLASVRRDDVESMARLKFALFAHGLRITSSALEKLAEDRDDLTIRDGIAGGLEIKLFDRLHVNVPIKEYFALLSPLALHWTAQDGFLIQDEAEDVIPIDILPIPDFAGRKISTGTPMLDIGQMFNERLSIEIFYGCVNTWANETACHFCELGAERKPAFVDLNDTQEFVAHCRDNPKINMRHILLGGGTPPDRLLPLYVEAAKRVRQETDVPLYVMMAPPPDLGLLDELRNAGVDEVGFNIEIVDRKLAQRVMPAKGTIPLARYLETMEYAVKLWPKQGAIRSILIVGLEPLENTLQGVRELCARGVMPILSPFRPVPGTPLTNHPTPTAEVLFQSWKRAQEIAQEYAMALGPTCIACQNNTISMPVDQHHYYY